MDSATKAYRDGQIVDLDPTEAAAIESGWAIEILNDKKTALRKAFVKEGVARISVAVPEWDSFEKIKLIASLWNLLVGANATAAQVLARDIYLFVRDDALTRIGALTDATIDLVAPTVAKPFELAEPGAPGWP